MLWPYSVRRCRIARRSAASTVLWRARCDGASREATFTAVGKSKRNGGLVASPRGTS
jgi:hypothetical protein